MSIKQTSCIVLSHTFLNVLYWWEVAEFRWYFLIHATSWLRKYHSLYPPLISWPISSNDLFLSLQKVKEEETVLNKILFLYMHSYPDTPLGKLLCLFFSFFIIYWEKMLKIPAFRVITHTGLFRMALKHYQAWYKVMNPLSPKSDQHQISPCNINAL